jgi:hypothetical protein
LTARLDASPSTEGGRKELKWRNNYSRFMKTEFALRLLFITNRSADPVAGAEAAATQKITASFCVI